MDSNDMFDDFGTFQVFTKSGTLDPLFITEILKKLQEIQRHFKRYYFIYISILDFQTFGN